MVGDAPAPEPIQMTAHSSSPSDPPILAWYQTRFADYVAWVVTSALVLFMLGMIEFWNGSGFGLFSVGYILFSIAVIVLRAVNLHQADPSVQTVDLVKSGLMSAMLLLVGYFIGLVCLLWALFSI